MTENPWNGRLLPSEKLLWTGRPGRGLLFTQSDLFAVPFSLVWCGFAIFWTTGVTSSGAPGFFTLWGMMFVCIGLYIVFGRFIVDAWARRSMQYAVTDKRVLIFRPPPFARFNALLITGIADVSLKERSDGRGTIVFGTPQSGRNRGMGQLSPAFDPTQQFLAIEDARRIFDMIQTTAQRSRA